MCGSAVWAAGLVGTRIRDLFPSAIAERQAAWVHDVFTHGQPIHREGPSAFPGREVWLGTWLVPLHSRAGTVTGVLGISRDLTERREMQRRLAHGQKLETIGHLAGGIAHDFNNIMQVVQGYSELALGALGPDTPTSRDLQVILKATDHAIALTTQLLAFGRRQVLELVSVDLNAVIRDNLDILQRLIGDDIEIVTNLRPVGATRADVSQLQQILLNLASNARDVMPQGGTLSIETRRYAALPGDDWEEPRAGPHTCLTLSRTRATTVIKPFLVALFRT